jgi:formylglycine-generating enzyme required for sulfatase activity
MIARWCLISSLVLLLAACSSTPPLPATQDNAPLVFVPAGEFTMGSTLLPNEKPIHLVYVNDFWIDQYEVSNALYQKCVAAQACLPPIEGYTDRHPDGYFANPTYHDFPAATVNWSEADQYCRWAGKRLPTEAEWEKAARGTDARAFPWGNTFDQARVNSAYNLELVTVAVNRYPDGVSPYGAYNMSGNVWEWSADWYDENYYATAPRDNPTGPLTGKLKALRGGGYGVFDAAMRTSLRRDMDPSTRTPYIGFRCARSAR